MTRKKQSTLCKTRLEGERNEALERLCKLYVNDAPMALERMIAAHADADREEYELCRGWLLKLGVEARVLGSMKSRTGRREGGKRSRASGETRAKLKESDVRAIRKSDEPSSVLANRYGVCANAINDARTRRTWRHLD